MEEQNARYWIDKLDLQPHPEGGYFKEVFRSQQEVRRPSSAITRQACTSIYYLLEGLDFSGFHRLTSDELWYYHKGVPLLIHMIGEDGSHAAFELSDQQTGNLSVAIKGGLWFAAEIPAGKGFTLVSCAVAPGFDFTEFEMAQKQAMIALYPLHTTLLSRLCR
jgi:predicted cupin superfamily sugar epimerase